MSVDWFRSWHGAPVDPKWRTIAKRAKVPTMLVVSIAWALMDRASMADDRGSIVGIDCETLADFLDADADDVTRVVDSMRDKGVLVEDRFASWEKRQPKRERENDDSAARVEAHRLRNKIKELEDALRSASNHVTPCNADETHVTPREEESRLDTSSLRSDVSCPNADKPVRTKAKRTAKTYPEDFERFWSAYPTDANMSKFEAAKVWARLPAEERELALHAVPAFREYCRKRPDYRPIHAERFLSKKRFEGHATPCATEKTIEIHPGSRVTEPNLVAAIERWKRNPDGWHCGVHGPPPPENAAIVKFAAEHGISLDLERAAA
jgi:hypothetical protein